MAFDSELNLEGAADSLRTWCRAPTADGLRFLEHTVPVKGFCVSHGAASLSLPAAPRRLKHVSCAHFPRRSLLVPDAESSWNFFLLVYKKEGRKGGKPPEGRGAVTVSHSSPCGGPTERVTHTPSSVPSLDCRTRRCGWAWSPHGVSPRGGSPWLGKCQAGGGEVPADSGHPPDPPVGSPGPTAALARAPSQTSGARAALAEHVGQGRASRGTRGCGGRLCGVGPFSLVGHIRPPGSGPPPPGAVRAAPGPQSCLLLHSCLTWDGHRRPCKAGPAGISLGAVSPPPFCLVRSQPRQKSELGNRGGTGPQLPWGQTGQFESRLDP